MADTQTARNDNQILLTIQQDYRAGNHAALGKLYEQLKTMAYRMIEGQKISHQPIAGMTAEEQTEKAHDAASYIIEQYIKRPNFTIKNFKGYIWPRVQWELYGRNHQTKRDRMVIYGNVPEKKNKARHRYVVTDMNTHAVTFYDTTTDLLMAPDFKKMRKKTLKEMVRTGRKFKNYQIDIMEVYE